MCTQLFNPSDLFMAQSFHRMSRNSWKPLFQVDFSYVRILQLKTIRLDRFLDYHLIEISSSTGNC